ncbi:MAG TPA: diguanylate cyclase [Mizugakiibacter sp.]
MKQALASDVIDALSVEIAVLDLRGIIVAVNEPWKRFACAHGGDADTFYVGANYLEVCEAAVRRGDDGYAQAMLDGLRGILQEARDGHTIEYPLPSPDGPRWFVAHVTRLLHEGAPYLAVVHEDITARKLVEQQLQEAEALRRKVLEALPVGVWIMDAQGQIIHGNSAGQRIWGGALYVGPERYGEYKGWWLSTGRRIAADEWAAARAIRNGEAAIDEEVRIEGFDGSSKIILNSGLPLRDAAGAITGAIIVNQDITARKAAEEKLRQANAAIDAMNRELQQVLTREQTKARTDELTGLDNRRYFFELAEQLFAVSQRYRTPLSVLLFDIDEFKHCNDAYGHQAGDAVLKQVAHVARGYTREADIIARYGGEEFIVMLPNTAAEGACAVAEAMRLGVAAAVQRIDGRELRVTISGGVAEILPGDDTLDRLVRRADEALYAAKRAGRNCVRLYAADR